MAGELEDGLERGRKGGVVQLVGTDERIEEMEGVGGGGEPAGDKEEAARGGRIVPGEEEAADIGVGAPVMLVGCPEKVDDLGHDCVFVVAFVWLCCRSCFFCSSSSSSSRRRRLWC